MSAVLIADDEEPVLEILSAAVSELGHEVVRAMDGAEALTLARAKVPDLIITDQMMPRMTGTELLQALRADRALTAVPVILMSAFRPKGADAAWMYLPKPVDLARFEQAISELLTTGERPERPPASDAEIVAASRSLEETLRWVAHEIKTPLSAALMASQLLLKRLESIGDESDRNRMQVVLRQLARIDTLAHSVLDAARLSEGRVALEKRPHDLQAFLVELVDEWRLREPSCQFILESEPAVIPFDTERVRQILDNLISNAVKYGLPSKVVKIQTSLSPGLASIRVLDKGRGIEASELPRIFDRFHRTSASGTGHGLGLYIGYMLAKLHGGTLTVRSTLGEGSTFCLSLPRTS